MLRALLRMVIVLWFTWVVGLIVLLVVNGLQGRSLIDTLRGPQRDLGATGTYLLLIVIAAGSMLIGWVGASIGLVHNYVGRAKERLTVLAVCALPVAVLFLLELYVPQPYHFTVVQIIGGVVGTLMMVRTARMYSFAYRAEHLSAGRIRFLLLIWLIGAACFVVPLIWVGLGAGIAILCCGLWALVFHSWASFPFAIQLMRHQYVPHAGD